MRKRLFLLHLCPWLAICWLLAACAASTDGVEENANANAANANANSASSDSDEASAETNAADDESGNVAVKGESSSEEDLESVGEDKGADKATGNTASDKDKSTGDKGDKSLNAAMANMGSEENTAGNKVNGLPSDGDKPANNAAAKPPEGAAINSAVEADHPGAGDAAKTGEKVNSTGPQPAVAEAPPAAPPQTIAAAVPAGGSPANAATPAKIPATEEKAQTAEAEQQAKKGETQQKQQQAAQASGDEDDDDIAVHYDREVFEAKQDVLPRNAEIGWVGYDFQKANKKLIVRIVTRGSPQFDLVQEKNLADQPELAVRFFQTQLRPKIRRDLDATEFRSPVAYIRMRENPAEEYVDVVLSFRESANPLIFAKDGNVQLTFAVADHYFAPDAGKAKVVGVAQDLSKAQILPEYEDGSDRPQKTLAKATPAPFVPDPGQQQFKDAPSNGGIPASAVAPSASLSTLSGAGEPTTAGDASAKAVDPAGASGATPASVGPASEAPSSGGQDVPASEEVPMPGDKADLDLRPDGLEIAGLSIISEFSVGAVGQFGAGDMGMDSGTGAGGSNIGEPTPVASAPGTSSGQGAAAAGAKHSGPTGKVPTSGVSDIVGADGASAPVQYSGKPVLLDFNDAELYLVLQAITAESGYNFVFPDEVGKKKVTLRLLNVPWDEALKAILETQGFSMVPIGQNIMRIDSIDNITRFLATREQTDMYKQRQIETKVLVMRLSHATAETIAKELTEMLTESIRKDPRIKISEDARTNSLIVEAPEYILGKVKAVTERMDLETPQVEIESRIVEVDRNMNNALGIAWGGMMQFDPGRGLGFGSMVFPNSVTSQFTVDPGVKTMDTTGNMSLKFGSLNKFLDLDLFLKMEEKRGLTNILQTNKLQVLDRQKATIVSGQSQFFRPAAGTTIGAVAGGGGGAAAAPAGGAGVGGLAEVTFNLSLEVTPEITASGQVNMELHINSDTPGDATGEVLADKNTRELTTKMSLKSGDTAVIGGIYNTNSQTTVTGIPYLMDIPLIGFLFRKTTITELQMEMLIMVTPRILNRTDVTATSALEDQSTVVPAAKQKPAAGGGNAGNDQNSMSEEGVSASNGAAAATKGKSDGGDGADGEKAGPNVAKNQASDDKAAEPEAVEPVGDGGSDSGGASDSSE